MSRPSAREQPSIGFATTLARGLAVLESFAPDAPLLGNSAIAARVGLSRPTVARLTSTLAELGYLNYDERAAKFRLGPRVLTLAHPMLAALRLRQIARPLMQELAASLPGVVSVGVLDGTRLVYLESARTSEHGAHVPDIGSSLPLLSTAMGRALVSMLPDPQSKALQRRLEMAEPSEWDLLNAQFRAGIAVCTAQGFCTSPGEFIRDIHAAAAPLFRARSGDCLAVNCSVTAFRLRPGELDEVIGPRLLSLARTIRQSMDKHFP